MVQVDLHMGMINSTFESTCQPCILGAVQGFMVLVLQLLAEKFSLVVTYGILNMLAHTLQQPISQGVAAVQLT